MSHLSAALKRLDLLLHRQILRLRASYELSLDEFRGLYISDEHVDRLVNDVLGEQQAGLVVTALTEQAELLRGEYEANLTDDMPWMHLITEFDLSPAEQDILLLALAPEIDLKYETLYAYLNNDVTRKGPTFDMALRLFASDRAAQRHLRRLLLKERTLLGSGLLQERSSARGGASWPATEFAAAPSVVRFVLGLEVWDERLTPFARYEQLSQPGPEQAQVGPEIAPICSAVERVVRSDQTPPLLIFEGRHGSGRAQAASAACRSLERLLLRIDLTELRAASTTIPEAVQALVLQLRLRPACIYVEQLDGLLNKEGNPVPEAQAILTALARTPGPVILAASPEIPWHTLISDKPHLIFRFDEPDRAARRRLWSRHLSELCPQVPEGVLNALAERYVLNPGQIARAVMNARNAQVAHGTQMLVPEVLFEAARAESGQQLGRLATKVRLLYTWDDVVLPLATMQRVKEIAGAIRHRHLVYSQWGFERRIAAGKGLKVFFTGIPGTGKTMTAGVIARDLELDLYKIDLSGVVSKYIGETEKNLDRIFRAAHAGNAILFFDEADALFGKRSEVKDAHDRYANIETSYLLQKMEEHEGAVILATNLRKNIDEAFSRRMHYVVEFPMPDEQLREHIWRGMFPSEVPLGDDVDFSFLARQFTLSGGDIQNVALDAAFLAAQNGQIVAMPQLVNAMARQLQKQGRLLSATDFKQYHALIEGT